MQPQEVPILDLNVYKGITFSLDVECQRIDEDGNVLGPLDLTGKTLRVVTWDLFPTDLVFDSSNPSDNQSSLTIDADPTTGLFNMTLSAEDLEDVNRDAGGWRIEMREGIVVDLLVRGTINVIPFETGSAI
jgi:hypothetical protein